MNTELAATLAENERATNKDWDRNEALAIADALTLRVEPPIDDMHGTVRPSNP